MKPENMSVFYLSAIQNCKAHEILSEDELSHSGESRGGRRNSS